jgi:hypothetical protein
VKPDPAHEVGSRHWIVFGIKALIAHRGERDIGAGDLAPLAERIEDTLRQLAMPEVGRFRGASVPHRHRPPESANSRHDAIAGTAYSSATVVPDTGTSRYGLKSPAVIEVTPIRVITVPSGNANVVLPPDVVEVATMLFVVVVFSFL